MRDFASLFRGRDDCYGWYGSIAGAKPTARGKLTGLAATRKGEVSAALYEAHLQGKERLGIVPIQKDGKCWFFCIDVDYYQDKGLCEDIAERIKECSLPLVQTRSKSGGIHLWCFLTDPIEADKARDAAKNFCKKMKLPQEHIDIFPAQDDVTDSLGNWLNLPYFGNTAHCVGDTGDGNLSLEEFLEYANSRLQHPQDLGVKSKERVEAQRSSAPPCIDFLIAEGVPEGYRDNAVAHFAVYAKKAFGDNWQEKVEEFNANSVLEPLDRAQMRSIIRSAGANTYQYYCEKIKGLYCDKKVCKQREYGVGAGTASVELNIDRIEKIDGENPVYRITIDGFRFQVTLEELFLYNAFRKVALGAINRFLPIMKQPEWEMFMRDKLEQMEIEKAAADTQTRDRIIRLFQGWAENATTDGLKEAIGGGMPYYDGKNMIFRGEDFLKIVDRNLERVTRERTWSYMRDYGTVIVDYTIEDERLPFWCYVVNGPLWFDIDKGKQK